MQTGLLRIALAAAAACVIALPGGGPRIDPLRQARAAAVPGRLPGHFGIGLSAAPDATGLTGWMPASGIPWDYAYAYLAGGVNTGTGWETWNTKGQYPLWYAESAAKHGYIPFFSYYELLQSSGSCGGCGENRRDLANLNDASLMASYYRNFALLMKRLGPGTYDGVAGFGKTVVVQIEPDFTGGYALQAVLDNSLCSGYCTRSGNNPSYLKASVAGSGDADVAAYPNTFQGFNWALLHLRDRYAPNVLLAFHISNWGTLRDVGSDTSPSLDAAALGTEAGRFAAQSGIAGLPAGTGAYDLLTNDVLDRDAGYYKYVEHNPSVWWDRLSVAFPNFLRWESYIRAAHLAAGRPFLIWQIPEGNQYFDSENNTDGHYQDNRAEYFFAHIGQLAQAGIVGLLFGAGNAGSTVHWDGKRDGITNPPSFCTGDGLSSGRICNDHISTVTDDDGGYLRMKARQYYAGGGYRLAGPTAAASPSGGAASTKTATPNGSPGQALAAATATLVAGARASAVATVVTPAIVRSSAVPGRVPRGGSEHLGAAIRVNVRLSGTVVDFEVYDAAGAKVFQWFAAGQSFAAGTPRSFSIAWHVPAGRSSGTYTFKIGIFGPGWKPLYLWDNAAATFLVT